MSPLLVLLLVSLVATVAPAAVKRDDVSSTGSTNNQGQNGQGNLYYYYYPVQDKSKDYAASASNQYSSSVTPDGSSSSSNGNSGLDQANSQSVPSVSSPSGSGSAPSDLTYSAQDLTYSAQALNPGLSDYTGSAQSSANSYDQQLSSLASQLQQQYGYAGNNQGSGNSGSNYQGSSNGNSYSNQGSYGVYDNSMSQGNNAPSNGQENAGQFSASNPVPNYGINPNSNHGLSGLNQATFIPTGSASQQVPQSNQTPQLQGFNPAQVAHAYGQFQQQIPYGSYGSQSVSQGTFEPPATGFRRYGIGSFIMPMLALAGLSLLIPTVTSLTASGRKKRSIDSDQAAKESAFGKYFDRLERYYSMYKTAVEREECMNRIVCELGDAMSGVRGKSPLFSDVSFKVIEKIVPTWMGTSVGVFKSAALSDQYGKCKKYSCKN